VDGIPTHHFNDTTLANCTLIAANGAGGDVDGLAHVFLEAHWRDDADLADQVTIERLVRELGFDPDPLIAAAGSQQIGRLYEQYTLEAIERNVFGSPTYFVDGDMFYGQDRL
jgi:2-hydroxychromene-2-carboxylate isomerase